MSLSTHVLDTAAGRPAQGIAVLAERAQAQGWIQIGQGRTDADGRVPGLIDQPMQPGLHRLTFATAPYFDADDTPAFWADIIITFVITDPTEHHHVPLLLSPFGYSTYRGS